MTPGRRASASRAVACAVTALLSCVAPLACGKIAGFEDLSATCPENTPRCDSYLIARNASGGRANATGGKAAASGGASGSASGGAPEESGGAGGSLAGQGGAVPGAGGGGEGGGTGGAPTCPEPRHGLHGPEMSSIRRADGSSFWIDRTEVTVGQYKEYLAAAPSFDEPLCAGEPPGAPFLCEGDAPLGDDMPRTCVDWCDALAYCTWAGKELCNDRTNAPAADARDELLAVSDFFAACSQSPGTTYGCGEGCAAADCNGAASGNSGVVPVGAETNCCVPDACSACAISDLSGNVAEWMAACNPDTALGRCVVRGGSYDSSANLLECGSRNELGRRTRYRTVGFRCCAH